MQLVTYVFVFLGISSNSTAGMKTRTDVLDLRMVSFGECLMFAFAVFTLLLYVLYLIDVHRPKNAPVHMRNSEESSNSRF